MAMREVEPRFKEAPEPEVCPCGCGVLGVPRKKAWRDNLAPHSRGCPCRRCVGSRQVGKAAKRERRIAKDFGGKRNFRSGAGGGVDTIGATLDIEETAGVAHVQGLRRWWSSKGMQAKLATLLSRNVRPRAFVACWDGKPQLAVLPYNDLVALADAACGACPNCGSAPW